MPDDPQAVRLSSLMEYVESIRKRRTMSPLTPRIPHKVVRKGNFRARNWLCSHVFLRSEQFPRKSMVYDVVTPSPPPKEHLFQQLCGTVDMN